MLDWLFDILIFLLLPSAPPAPPKSPGKFPVPPKRINPDPQPPPRVKGPEITPKEREDAIKANPQAYAASQLLPQEQRESVETMLLLLHTGKAKRWVVRYDVFIQWVIGATGVLNAYVDALNKSLADPNQFGANPEGWKEVTRLILGEFNAELRQVERLVYRMSQDQPPLQEKPPLTRQRSRIYPKRIFPGPFKGARL